MMSSSISKTPLKIAFAGTPDIAAEVLTALINAGHQIIVGYCQPDRKVGRGKKLAIGPVKQICLENNIPVEQPLKFDQTTNQEGLNAQKQLASYNVDLMIVIAYGLLLPQSVLDTPRFGCINIHASLLPRWRGAAPIQRAIEAGDEETGITIMQMDKGLDTGNMLLKKSLTISGQETGTSLHDRLASLGSKAVIEYIESIDWSKERTRRSIIDHSVGTVQDNNLSNYAKKLTKSEAEIDWAKSAKDIERQIRAFNAWPVSFTYIAGNRIRIWEATIDLEKTLEKKMTNQNAEVVVGKVLITDKQSIKVVCGDGQLLDILELQADGSKRMAVDQFLNGNSHWFESDDKFGHK